MNYIWLYFEELVNLTVEMSPYLLLGLLIAGVLHVFIKDGGVGTYFGKDNLRSVVNAALLGVPLPLCSCGVIPTGVSLHKEGASRGATVSFLVSTPQTGVDSILITWSMLNFPFAIVRPFAALTTGIYAGILTNIWGKSSNKVHEPAPATNGEGDCHYDEKRVSNKFVEMLRYAFIEFLEDIAKWLVLGLAIAAAIAVVIPPDFFTAYVGNNLLSMALVLLVSVPLYVCATGSVPIAAALMSKGLSPGSALVFLMAGPATNAATIAVLRKTIGPRATSIYLFSIVTGAAAFGLTIDYLLPRSWFAFMQAVDVQHHCQTGFMNVVSTSSAIVLSLLLLYVFIKPFIKSKMNAQNIVFNHHATLVAHVGGMTCNHCKANVEKHVGKIAGVEKATVDLASATLTVTGANLDPETIMKTVQDIGYEWGGLK